jgi:hypothetical protein
MKKLTSNEIEAVNRAETTALLIITGSRVYRPEADFDGEGLILRTPSGEFYPVVQLKACPTLDLNKFGKKVCGCCFWEPTSAPKLQGTGISFRTTYSIDGLSQTRTHAQVE